MKQTNKDYSTWMIQCLITIKVLTYTKHASQNKTFFRNNQIIIGSPIVTQEITMDEIFNMIGLNSKRGRK